MSAEYPAQSLNNHRHSVRRMFRLWNSEQSKEVVVPEWEDSCQDVYREIKPTLKPPQASPASLKLVLCKSSKPSHMRFFNWAATLPCLLAAVVQSAPNFNRPTLVSLRIEGAEKTHFEGVVLTKGHNITTALGGNHHCDGTNLNANPHPGPTVNSALDDAARKHGFTFDGAFFPEFDDFLISTIAGESNTNTQFWTTLVNFNFTQVGGCQQEVTSSDQVLFAFDGFAKAHILKLSGPTVAHVNKPVVFTVVDGLNGKPVAGAEVDGQATGPDGKASVTFGKVGLHGVKAQKSDSVRSNQINIKVIA